LFSENGYEGSSLDELAERLNISKPTIYYYVGNKHNCYYEISLRAQQPMLRALSEIEKMPGTALDKLTALLRRYVLEVATTDYGRCLLRIGRRVLNGEKRKEIDRNMLTADKKLMKLLKLGMKEGSITDFEPTVTFYTIFGAINWDVIWYSEKGDVTPIELADRQIQIFLHGLRPRD
ncbi:MAG: TetR/AcrR family transcriptional regulator, partial [Phycisphaerales bacterium]|nr:TetR/AcrR family transcriptional regulator [Phycisphaerales bacterium]